jgi:hypothetical protein
MNNHTNHGRLLSDFNKTELQLSFDVEKSSRLRESKCECTAKVKARGSTYPHCSKDHNSTQSALRLLPHTTMDPSDESEPLALTPAPHPYQEYVPGAIKPCTTHINDSGNKVASLFHLLTCGHVVALYDSDQRCGRNCQHMATLIPSQSLQGSNGSQAYVILITRKMHNSHRADRT